MYPFIHLLLEDLTQQFETIPTERKALLQRLAAYIQERITQKTPVRLVYICTHNSRRSHFGQIAAAVAAKFYGIPNVSTFSGGTEVTAFNPNAIRALQSLGFIIESDGASANPRYCVRFGENQFTTCFSKVYDDNTNPKDDFAAIMTCSDAETNCPFIPGVSLRIGTTYEDPKKADGTPQQDETYVARFRQIATETLYVFSLVTT
ncbi:MAG: protein-tyrosine-phosphatase [Spirosomataceae bacterium]